MSWIWFALALQFLGYLVDAVWHGVLHPGAEPRSAAEMLRHLATVHLPLYIGAASVLVAISFEFRRRLRGSVPGIPLSIALVGAAVSAGAEAWHAFSHLGLDTHVAPAAGILSVIGFVVAIGAMSGWARTGRGRAGGTTRSRRAA